MPIINSPSLKPALSIELIGSIRFKFGIIIGLIWATLFGLFFIYILEVIFHLQPAYPQINYLNNDEKLFYRNFYAVISVVLGMQITLMVWFAPFLKMGLKKWSYRLMVFSLSGCYLWTFLSLQFRFTFILYSSLYTQSTFESPLVLNQDFFLIFLLLPPVLFFMGWLPLQLQFRSWRWIGKSSLTAITLALILKFFLPFS